MLIVLSIKHKIKTSLCFLIPYAVFWFYGIVGFPEVIAKLTLFSNIPVVRLLYPLAYLDAIMLICSVSLMMRRIHGDTRLKNERNKGLGFASALVSAVIYGCILALFAYANLANPPSKVIIVLTFMIFTLGAFVAFLPNYFTESENRSRSQFLLLWTICVLSVGLCVNPVQMGVKELENDDVVEMIEEVNSDDPEALWVADNTVYAQACVSTGAKTINSINSYPNLTLWKGIDPEGQYEFIYNRYAHIDFSVGETTSFELIQDDRFGVKLTDEDVLKLGVKYWLSSKNLASHHSDIIRYEPLCSADGISIFKVVRSDS